MKEKTCTIISQFPKAQGNSFRNSDQKYVFQNIVTDNFSPEKKMRVHRVETFLVLLFGSLHSAHRIKFTSSKTLELEVIITF